MPQLLTAYKIISKRLRSIKDLLTAYEEYLTLCDYIIANIKQQPEAILMIDRIQRKMNRIKKDKYKLLHYRNLRDLYG